MSFQEKSAWVMAVALVLGGALYAAVVALLSAELGRLAPPMIPLIAVYAAVLTVLAAVGHAVIAALAPRDADRALDERERAIELRAGYRAGYVVAAGAFLSLGAYLVRGDGHLLFYGVFGSLMLGQLAEYGQQIVFHRTRV